MAPRLLYVHAPLLADIGSALLPDLIVAASPCRPCADVLRYRVCADGRRELQLLTALRAECTAGRNVRAAARALAFKLGAALIAEF